VTVEVDAREVLDAEAAGESGPMPSTEAALICGYGVRPFMGRGVRGTAVCVETVETDEEEEDEEGVGEALRGGADVWVTEGNGDCGGGRRFASVSEWSFWREVIKCYFNTMSGQCKA
jgi:hypothetical protein